MLEQPVVRAFYSLHQVFVPFLQLVVQQFLMEALHYIMMSNNCQILGMYDEMSVMYGQLDAYKHSGSRLDRSTLLDLYNGGSWSRNFRNKEQAMVKMQQTAFNMCGFIQPAFVLSGEFRS